ncbi:MAG: phosphatidate cytidylyltransferase [Firmicutes bacterium]|nr:phosphatidate cytidylyltransferase [Bacillota bacterium]
MKWVRIVLTKRILSSIVGIIILFACIITGTIPFISLILLLTIIAIYEYNRMLPVKSGKNFFLMTTFSIFIISYTYLSNRGLIDNVFPALVYLYLIVYFIFHFLFIKNNFLESLSYNTFGLIYIAGGFSFLLFLREFSTAPFNKTTALWLVLLATWASDTGGYFIGRFLGSHKLAEEISPNKTVEGAIGSVLLTIIVVGIYMLYFGYYSFYWFIYAVVIALTAITGDLFESKMKRELGLKDSGDLIPGHGGILDRFDTLLFTAPVTYFFLVHLLV